MKKLPDEKYQGQQRRDSLTREGVAAMRFIRLGYRPFALGEEEIRHKLGYIDESKCADMIFYGRRPGVALIVEQKRQSDTNHAVEQLRNTAFRARVRFTEVDPVIIFSWWGMPAVDEVPLSGGFFAIRNRLTGDYTLFDSSKRPVTVGAGEEVRIVFGP